MMRAGTLFSGIGAPECAAPDIDWRWAAEIDPFAAAVHAARFPGIPNLGNVLEIDWHAVEPVDLVVGGPPCQDYSVAGQRASLSGARGDLTLQYARTLDAIDPAWSVTENVPGWLSTPDNAFGTFLGILVGADAALVPGIGQRWTDAGVVAGPQRTAAWRILDAQYFGVPQRRRRVFVVACRGAGNFACAEALFPLRTSLRRDTAPRRETREDIAAAATHCLDLGGNKGMNGGGWSTNLTPPLGTNEAHAVALRGHSDYGAGLPSLRFKSGDCGGGSEALVAFGGIAYTLHGADKTVSTATETEIAGSVRTKPPGSIENSSTTVVMQAMSVRRLTPRECARLQGFPDDWCDIQYRGKPAADGPMYRAYGNSMAVPVVGWVLSRVQQAAAASLEEAA